VSRRPPPLAAPEPLSRRRWRWTWSVGSRSNRVAQIRTYRFGELHSLTGGAHPIRQPVTSQIFNKERKWVSNIQKSRTNKNF
jgi:hypothetical protein